MKKFFKAKAKTSVEVVQQTRGLLQYFYSCGSNFDPDADPVARDKMKLVCKLLCELRLTLYGSSDVYPVQDACSKLANEFFKEDTFRLLVLCLPTLNMEACIYTTQVVANLQVNHRSVACKYLEANMDIIDILVGGYENPNIALHYGEMLRVCVCHQIVAKYVLEKHLRTLFGYLQLPSFGVSSDASATFKELLTRHKDTVANFLTINYDWFFKEYNTKLLQSSDYVTRRQAIKLLDEVLLNPSNTKIKERYLSCMENMIIFMYLLKDSHACSKAPFVQEEKTSKTIQLDAFHIFKLFVINPIKPPEIISTLITNRNKLLHFIENFTLDKEDLQFETDKNEVLKEIDSIKCDSKYKRSGTI